MQLESWLTEIEQRVTQREAETAAELSRVMNRLKEAQAKNKQADAQIEQALESNANAFSDSSNHIIQKLRAQMDDLRQRLEVEERGKRRTEKRRSESDLPNRQQIKIQQLEQKLLQQQVEFSRERADIAQNVFNLKD